MNSSKFLLLIFAYLIITGCKKDGCTDKASLNYSVEATEDDGSCQYPKFMRIKSIELRVNETTDKNGVEWDASGFPDCFVKIEAKNLNFSTYQSEIVEDVKTDQKVIYTIEPNILVSLEDTENLDITFSVYDNDGVNANVKMTELFSSFLLKIVDFGYGYDHFYKRILMEEQSIYKEPNSNIGMAVIVDWE